MMGTRFGQIAAQPFAGRRAGGLRWIVIAASVVTVLMLYVGGKVQIVRLGYEIESLEQQKRELERANRSLQIEASSLAAPGRIEEIAVKRLGMVRPPKDSVVVVKRLAAGTQRKGGERAADAENARTER